MIKVGIITIHKINNYGAVLQAYALNKFLRNNKFDTKTIDFCTYRVKESRQIYEKSINPKAVLRNIMAFLYHKRLKLRNKNFDVFINSNISLTEKSFYSNEELKSQNNDFDYYICGSDQIWNTHCLNYSPAFVLDFVKDKSKCISYAASVGNSTIHKSAQEDFERNLSGFKALSVREYSAVQLVADISKKDVTHVCDPVFLFDGNEWQSVVGARQYKKPYIFFYFVHNGNMEGMRDYVKILSKKFNMPIVVVNRDLREMSYKNIKAYGAGPSEFLSYIKFADLIITNSFHAFSFSIIFKKNFLVFADTGEESTSSRIFSQAKRFGLEERVVNRDTCQKINPFDDVDFTYCDKVIGQFVSQSQKFLLDALSD